MKKLLWVPVVVGTLILLLELLCGLLWLLRGTPPGLPTGPLPQGSKYKVAVLGDIQKGLANFENLLARVKQEGAGLIVQTGDLVAENDPGHYRLIKLAYARSGLNLPFIVTPGNHDLKANRELFQREIGPLEQTVVAGDVAYVLVQNAWEKAPDLQDLDRRIAAAGPNKTIVLAMHQPPFDIRGEVRAEYASFLKWLEKSGVAYLFSGHVHTYLRKMVGSTVVIVNGVGGDYDSWQLDQKVYATLLEVDGGKVTDRAIELPPEHGLIENLDHAALGHFAEAFRRQPELCGGATLLVAALVAWALRRIIALREPFKTAPG